MRYLEASGRWVSTGSAMPTVSTPQDDSEITSRLVERGLLHPSYIDEGSVAGDWLLKQGIAGPMSNYVRLTDGPAGQARWASYYDVLMSNPWGHATIHTVSRGLGRLPLKIYLPDPSDETEPGTVAKIINPDRRTPEGRVAWALRYPNQLPKPVNSPASRKALLYSTVVSKLIHGNSLWEKRFDANGDLAGFKFIPNEQISMDEEALLYTISEPQYGGMVVDLGGREGDNGEYTLTPDKVVHFGLWESGRRPWSPSPVRALHASIALYDAVTRHMVAFFNNGARVSGHLKLPEGKGNNSKAREAARDEIRKLYSGADNAGRVLITEADWQQMHREPEFDGIVNLMKFSRDEIFAVYGVPPPVMGVIERAIMPLDPSTEIRMSDGTSKVLGDIEVGDLVVTHTGAEAKVERVQPAGIQPRLKLTTRLGKTLIGAPDHPILTDSGWRRLGDLAVGEGLVSEPEIRVFESFDDDARLLGYWIGDGSTRPSVRSFNADFTNSDPAVMADFTERCERKGWSVHHPEPGRASVSGGVRDWLRFHGLGGKTAADKRVPDQVMRSGEPAVAEFLSGLFECDGCPLPATATRRPDISYVSVSLGLIEDFQHLLRRFSVDAVIGHQNRDGYDSWVLRVPARHFERFKEIVTLVGVKAPRLAAIQARPTPEGDGSCGVGACGQTAKSKGLCHTHRGRERRGAPLVDPEDAVKAIEALAPGPVVCISVDHPDHSYLGHAIPVHNSNAREMRDQYVRDLIGPHAELLAADFEAQVIDVSESLREKQIFAEFDVDEQLRPDLWKRAENFRALLLAYTPNELRQIERQQKLTGDANPNGYADTIQRPLNESPLNNLPDYVERDRIGSERFEWEKEKDARDAAAPTSDNGAGEQARQAAEEANRRASIEAGRLALDERRQAHLEEVDRLRLAQDAERIAIERERMTRTADQSERRIDEVDVPRVGQDDNRIALDERRVVVAERLADHTIEHGSGNEPHGPEQDEPAPPDDDEPAPPDDDEPAPPDEEEPDADEE